MKVGIWIIPEVSHVWLIAGIERQNSLQKEVLVYVVVPNPPKNIQTYALCIDLF